MIRTVTITLTEDQRRLLLAILRDAVDSADDEGATGEAVDVLLCAIGY